MDYFILVICSAKINVGFAVDGSSKMGNENFGSAIQFAANVSNHLDVDTNNTWIFLTYGNQKRVFKTKSDLISLTPANEAFPNATDVLLGANLDVLRGQLSQDSSQRDAVNVVILIGSHKSDDDIAVPAVLLKALNVTIVSLGVGGHYSMGQLKEIASDPDGDYFIGLNAWREVNEYLAKNIARKICQGMHKYT